MYCCPVTANSRLVIFTLNIAHWQKVSKLSSVRRFELVWKDRDNINRPLITELKKKNLQQNRAKVSTYKTTTNLKNQHIITFIIIITIIIIDVIINY